MAMTAPGARQLAPLRPNTRQRRQKLPTIAVGGFGTQAQFTMPQVGLFSRLFLWANLTITDTAASPSISATTFGPFNALKRITGSTNLGTASIFDISGYGAYLQSKVWKTDTEFKLANADVTTDTFYQYPTTAVQNTAKAVQFCLMIPIAANDGEQFDIGLINLQAPEIRFTVSITFGALADIYSTSDTVTLGGTVYPYYEYYEVPDPNQVALPQRIMHRMLEEATAFAATGDVTYLIPRQGVLLQLIQYDVLNGAITKLTTDVTGRRIVFNKTDTPYQDDYIVPRILARERYGHLELPGGVFVDDFWHANGRPSNGDLRDAIDTEALSTLEFITTISSGATLGSGNNSINSIRRITQQY